MFGLFFPPPKKRTSAQVCTLVPIRPRRRCGRRSLRTFSPGGVSLRPGSLAFNPDTPRSLSTPLLMPFNNSTSISRRKPRRRERSSKSSKKARGKRPRASTSGSVSRSSSRSFEGCTRSYSARASSCSSSCTCSGAFYTLVPIRPRWRGERRSLRTFAVVSLRPSLAFNPRHRRLSTPTDAFELHPDIALYGMTLTGPFAARRRRRPVGERRRARGEHREG